MYLNNSINSYRLRDKSTTPFNCNVYLTIELYNIFTQTDMQLSYWLQIICSLVLYRRRNTDSIAKYVRVRTTILNLLECHVYPWNLIQLSLYLHISESTLPYVRRIVRQYRNTFDCYYNTSRFIPFTTRTLRGRTRNIPCNASRRNTSKCDTSSGIRNMADQYRHSWTYRRRNWSRIQTFWSRVHIWQPKGRGRRD